jgi:PhnB protein
LTAGSLTVMEFAVEDGPPRHTHTREDDRVGGASLTWAANRGSGRGVMTSQADGPVISLMVAVADARIAADWYRRALGATELWNLGSVVGLEIAGAPFFLAEPESNGWSSPTEIGTTTVRVEVFVDDPDAFIERAVAAGADGSGDHGPRGTVGHPPAGRLLRPVRAPVARRRQVSAEPSPVVPATLRW